MVLRAHERLEVAPRLAGDEAEELAVLFPELGALRDHGLAQGMRDERGRRPQGQDREGGEERARAQHPDQEESHERDHRARDHLDQERPNTRSPHQTGRAGRAGGGRLPLQQAALGRPQTDEGQDDRVGALVGLAGEERDL